MNNAIWVLSFVCLAAGLAMTAAGLILRSYKRSRQQLTGHTSGRVINLELRELPGTYKSHTFRNLYFPVFEFYANGKLYRENYPYGAYPSSFRVGDEVQIDYDPEDPHEYELRQKNLKDMLPSLIYMGGVSLTAAGALLFIIFIVSR